MPTNIYGTNDSFNPETSHVSPRLILKFHHAKVSGDDLVVLWGSGSPMREFLHSDDLAAACLFLLAHYNDDSIVNVGVEKDITIAELAELIREIVGFKGEITWDLSKPDGTPRKLLDTSKIRALGWRPKISLEEGLTSTYKWFRDNML
jgi:GDP-L-fucose synthase